MVLRRVKGVGGVGWVSRRRERVGAVEGRESVGPRVRAPPVRGEGLKVEGGGGEGGGKEGGGGEVRETGGG